MIGCLLIAPRADRFGRKPLLLFSLVLITVGMTASALVRSFWELALARGVTGLGVGGILPALAAVAMEFSNEKRRNFSVGIVQAGWPLGAVFTGLYSAWALQSIGWRGLFATVAAITGLMIPLVAWLMPESVEFLARRQPPGALERINAVLRKMRREPLSQLSPAPASERAGAAVVGRLLAPDLAAHTIRLWIGVFFGFITLYTLISWVPTFARTSGMQLQMAIYAGTALNVGALIGSTCIGLIAARTGLRHYILGSMSTAVVLMAIYGHLPMADLPTLLLIALIGATVQGGFNTFYPITARVYPAELRASGIGYAVGIGRAGAVAGPLIAGYFLAAKVPMSTLFLVFSVPLVLSGLAAFSIRSANLRSQ
jgi:AAHS family 4-hydroxybenzoate transporter-like MFS transporter